MQRPYLNFIRSFLLIVAILLTACTRSQEDAQEELKQRKIPFTEKVFLSYLIKGDDEVVRLFLDAGVDPNLLVDVRDAGYPTPPKVYQQIPKIPILLIAMEKQLTLIEATLKKAGAKEEEAHDFAERFTNAELAYKQEIEKAVEQRLSLPPLPAAP